MLSFKQSHAEIQNILDNAGSGGGGGTSDYADLTNKPSINSVTLSGNKTSSDLGIREVSKPSQQSVGKVLTCYSDDSYSWLDLPEVREVPKSYDSDDGKVLTVNSSGTPIWSAPAAPTVEYADWGNVHLSYEGANVGITGTYEVEYNGFATIVFNTDYREIAQNLSAQSFQGLEANFTITLTRDQQDYSLIYTTLYFPGSSSSSQLNFITTNSNFSLALPVLAGDEISLSISSSSGIDQMVGGAIEHSTKLECFVQKYV